MKKHIGRALLLGIIALFSCTFAIAQKNNLIKTKIAFDFYVGDKKMPAGDYVIQKLTSSSSPAALLLRRTDGTAQIIIVPALGGVKARRDSTLSFNRYGGLYYLSEIRNASAGIAARLLPHKTEINLAKQFNKSNRGADCTRQTVETTAIDSE